MSFDPNANDQAAPFGSDQATKPADPNNQFGAVKKPKSNKKMWFLGCGGCLFLVLLVCGGGGAFLYFKYAKPAQDFIRESHNLAANSTVVIEALGENITIGDPTGWPETKGTTSIIRFPISGDDNSGELVLGMSQEMDGTNIKFIRSEFYIEVDDEKIEIDEDAEFGLDIDMGDDGFGDEDSDDGLLDPNN